MRAAAPTSIIKDPWPYSLTQADVYSNSLQNIPWSRTSLLLRRLLAIKVLRKLPLDSTRAALFLGERVHHPHVFLVAPRDFIVVIVEVILLIVRAATSAVAVRSTAAVEFVVGGEFVGRVVGAVVVLG
jgi:hypothetical protein